VPVPAVLAQTLGVGGMTGRGSGTAHGGEVMVTRKELLPMTSPVDPSTKVS
jgi:hypothetical protein